MEIPASQLLMKAKADLAFLGNDEASASAEFLLADLIGCSRAELPLKLREAVSSEIAAKYAARIEQRRQHEPVAYILGKAHFWNEELEVSKECLIPRPETELLVEKFIEKLESRRSEELKILDLCSGSGAIGIAILREFPACEAVFADVSTSALEIVRMNLSKYGLVNRARCVESDLFESLGNEKWDVIVSNPPYLSFQDWENAEPEIRQEPEKAFLAGPDGFEFYRRIAAKAAHHLKSGGYLFLELGMGQAEEVEHLIHLAGLRQIETFKDFQDIKRVLIARV